MGQEQQQYKAKYIKYLEQASNLPTPTVTAVYPVTKTSFRNLEGTESPWHEQFHKPKETIAFDYPDSSIVRRNGVGDSVYKTFGNLWKNKGNDNTDLFLESLDKLTKK